MSGTVAGEVAAVRPALSRSSAKAPPPAPIRVVHLGLGNFFRAHQAWYTALAPDAAQWGIAGFTGRSAGLADALTAQEGLYTLVTRSGTGDSWQLVPALTAAHAGPDIASLVGYVADPWVAVITLTVTEAGYLRNAAGGLDAAHPDVRGDLTALSGWHPEPAARRAPQLRTIPARLVAALAARMAAGAGPLAVVSCDNLPGNGQVTATVVADLAAESDPALAKWIAGNVSFVTTMVDRITPATTAADIDGVVADTGLIDHVPVVTEPFSEWVLTGDFPAGRPTWEAGGARFVDDVAPYEERKLWLLNGGHTLLAYLGLGRGHATIAEALGDSDCRFWLQSWWDLAARHVRLPAADLSAYRWALLDRFANPAIAHQLGQIGTDGSLKIPVRILPVLQIERRAGRLPEAPVRVLAGWIDYLRGPAAQVRDADKTELLERAAGPVRAASRAILHRLDARLAGDQELLTAVASAVQH